MTPVIKTNLFKPDLSKAEAKPEAEALLQLHPLTVAFITSQELLVQRTIFKNRTYEDHSCFFLVFKPFNAAYIKDPSWFEHKGLDAVRKNINTKDYFITREINSKKVHINVLCYDKRDLVERYHDKNRLNKYRVYCKKIDKKIERDRILKYITKEHYDRPYKKYIDYNVHLNSAATRS